MVKYQILVKHPLTAPDTISVNKIKTSLKGQISNISFTTPKKIRGKYTFFAIIKYVKSYDATITQVRDAYTRSVRKNSKTATVYVKKL